MKLIVVCVLVTLACVSAQQNSVGTGPTRQVVDMFSKMAAGGADMVDSLNPFTAFFRQLLPNQGSSTAGSSNGSPINPLGLMNGMNPLEFLQRGLSTAGGATGAAQDAMTSAFDATKNAGQGLANAGQGLANAGQGAMEAAQKTFQGVTGGLPGGIK
ncbi:uncharacterized protein LOC129566473 [Sitodiplosis mosellana]|uniref:uncharacterized protein LOC129566473 n=1 Tax=Sitodiplosis mosellana TaxID=263140 RepID=UPI0024447EC5|nr:uncharacterized protein LOC129566473 [Sitodiplosis mosellana]